MAKSKAVNINDSDELPLGLTTSACSSYPLKKSEKSRRQIIPADELSNLYLVEQLLRTEGYQCIAGLDEAGRGPLCGVVCAGAVVFAPNTEIEGVNDSKKLTEDKRASLFEIITEKALAFGVGIAEPDEIDKMNILQATKLACRRALAQIAQKGIIPDLLLLDALELPDVSVEQRSLIKGDARSFSIAAASIIAKVTRDRLMKQCAVEWPQYGLEKHKGYPTKAHYEAIERSGASTLHRKSFLHKNDLFSETKDGGNKPLVWSLTANEICSAIKRGQPITQKALDVLRHDPPILPRCEREYLEHLIKTQH